MKKMKTLRNKTKTATIALVLVLTIAASFITCLPAVNATVFDTYAFITVAPNPIGVGQPVMVVWWLNRFPATATGTTGDRWQNITVTVTKPDASEQTLGPFTSDAVGSNWFKYVPDQVGKYFFQMSFPGQTLTGGIDCQPQYYKYIGDHYDPSISTKVELTVQEEAIEPFSAAELPTDYWARPISAENREWWSISGNWLQENYDRGGSFNPFNPYTTAPNTAHIVWTREVKDGGLIGGEFGAISYLSKLSWSVEGIKPPVIINGKLYYNTFFKSKTAFPGFVCVDIRTGEELWRNDDATITLGQIINLRLPNDIGGLPYLWKTGTTWEMYDASSGNLIMTLKNATSVGGRTGAPLVYSPDGEMLVYILDGAKNWLAMWNSSRIPQMYEDPAQAAAGTGSLAALTWSPHIGTFDWRTGIQWNVSVPDVPGTQRISTTSTDVIYASVSFTLDNGLVVAEEMAYSLKKGEEGQVLWGPINRTAQPSLRVGYMQEGVLVEYVKETMQWYGYDIYTGDLLWGPTEPYKDAWDMYYSFDNIAYGKLFHKGFGGKIYCHDLTTGKLLWTYWTGSSGFETPYGHWPFGGGSVVADGKIYAATGEHSPTQPNLRGEGLHVVDVETGEGVWNISGWYSGPAIADGYMVAYNGYDNQIYSFGKGLTETTITAPEAVQPLGALVLIKGTVTDQSPGDTCLGIPAAGTPAISDDYMTEWMEYLYMQKPIPEDAEGVEVILTTLDPNGNTYELGRTTTDISGTFGCVVDPPVPGKYKIIATFEGSESYFSSTATSYFVVGEAPSAAQPIEPEPTTPAPTEPTPTEPEPTEPEPTEPQPTEPEPTEPEPTEPAEAPLFSTTDLAIIAAVAVAAVIGIAAYWQLRKRK
jgi:hypothetical protein